MIKAIIFDIGGVIQRTEDRRPRAQLEARHGLAAGEAEAIVLNSEMGRKAQLGQITTAQLWEWVQRRLLLTKEELAEFQKEFWAGDRIDWEIIDLIDVLRENYRIAIISNASDSLPETVAKFDPNNDLFELVVGSFAEGVMKPAAEIYQRTLTRLNVQASNAIFIDDFAQNVKGAQSVGMKAIHFQVGMDLAEELAALGVEVN